MSELEEPQTISSSDLSKARSVLATSLASRPYSCAVLWPTCQGPSISLPRHQCLTPNGSRVAVLLAQVAPVAAGRAVDVFDEIARLVEPARAEVDREHHLGADGVAPVGEFVHADGVGVRRVPGEVEPRRPLFARADAVFPIIGGNEIAAGIAHDRNLEVAHELGDVAAHAVRVGGRMTGLVDAGVDRAAEMLEEGAVEPIVDLRDRVIPMGGDGRFHVSSLPRDFAVYIHFLDTYEPIWRRRQAGALLDDRSMPLAVMASCPRAIHVVGCVAPKCFAERPSAGADARCGGPWMAARSASPAMTAGAWSSRRSSQCSQPNARVNIGPIDHKS